MCEYRHNRCVIMLFACIVAGIVGLIIISLFYHILTLNILLFRFQQFNEETRKHLPLVQCGLEVLADREYNRERLESNLLSSEEKALFKNVGYDVEKTSRSKEKSLLACIQDKGYPKYIDDIDGIGVDYDIPVDTKFIRNMAFVVEEIYHMGDAINTQWDELFVEKYKEAMFEEHKVNEL